MNMNYGLSNDYQQFRGCFMEAGLWISVGLAVGGVLYWIIRGF